MSTSDNCVDFAATQSSIRFDVVDWADTAPDMCVRWRWGVVLRLRTPKLWTKPSVLHPDEEAQTARHVQTCLPLDMIQSVN